MRRLYRQLLSRLRNRIAVASATKRQINLQRAKSAGSRSAGGSPTTNTSPGKPTAGSGGPT